MLRHESGKERAHYDDRLYEEALVIGFQHYWNTGRIKRALEPYADRLHRWSAIFRGLLNELEAAA